MVTSVQYLKVSSIGPCIRGKFLNFLFSRVSEKFIFLNSQKFCKKKICLKFGNNFLFFGSKPLFLSQKVWIKFGNPCFGVKNSHFQKFWTYKNFGICSFLNFPKNTKKWRSTWTSKIAKKLILTQKPTQMFGLKFGMQGLSFKLGKNM